MSASTSSGVAVAAAPRSSGVAVIVSPAHSHPDVGRHLRALGLHTINAVDPFLAARLVAGRHVELAMVEATTPAAIAAILVLARAAQDSGYHTDIVALEAPDTTTAAAALEAGATDVLSAAVGEVELGLRLRGILERRTERINLLSRLEDLEWLSGTDLLTALPNRRSLAEALSRHASVAGRHGLALAVVMFDVDRFKGINDRVGHGGGDAALCEVGDLLRAGVREGDVVGRWGGDEFLAVLPHTPLAEAELMAERICSSVADAPLVYGNVRIPFTMSAGCTATPGSLEDLLARSDLALYESKAAGRNQVRTRS